MLIKINDVSKKYHSKVDTKALDLATLMLPDTGLICITGESGSGKTTLLNLMGTLDKPTSGKIIVNGKDITKIRNNELAELRNTKIGFIFQDNALLDDETVYENLKCVTDLQQELFTDADAKIKNIIDSVSMSECINKKVVELSGGQKQRVAIARAVIKAPSIILADEPTGNLDSENSDLIFGILKKLSKKILVVVVTHDRKRVSAYADRNIVLKNGKIVSDTSAHQNASIVINECIGGKIKEDVIDEKNLIIEINKIIQKRQRAEINISFFGNESNGADELVIDKTAATTRKLGIRDYLKYSAKNMRLLGLSRIICIVFIFVFLEAFILISEIANNDFSNSMKNYFSIKSVDVAKLAEKRKKYGDNAGSDYVSKGEYLYDNLKDIFSSKNVVPYYSSIVLALYDDSIINIGQKPEQRPNNKIVVTCVQLSEADKMNYLWGHAPKESNEILLSDYIANELGIKAETNLFLSGKNVTVCGVVRTDYLTYNPDLHVGLNDEYFKEAEYLENLIYKVVYVNEKFYKEDRLKHRENHWKLTFPGTNVLQAHTINKYLSSAQIGLSTNPDLKNNEFEISARYAEENFYTEEDIPHEIALKNLQDEKYGNRYHDVINLNQIIGEKAVAVNITNNQYADIYVNETVYNDIFDCAYDFLRNDGYVVFIDSKKLQNEWLDKLDEAGIVFLDPNLDVVYHYSSLTENYCDILFWVQLVLCGMIILMIFIMVLFERRSIRGRVGIMTTLGFSLHDILGIRAVGLIIETIGITTLTGVTYFVLNNYVNYFAKESYDMLYEFRIFIPNLLLMSVILVSFISVYFIAFSISTLALAVQPPISNLKKKLDK